MKFVFVSSLALAAVLSAVSAPPPSPTSGQQERNFVAFLRCTTNQTVASSFWIPTSADLPAATQQVWVDLSLFQNNFALGTFIGVGPILPGNEAQHFLWLGLLPERRHYYRLNALTPGGWVEVGRAEFDTPDCRNVDGFDCETSGRLRVVFLLSNAPSIANGHRVDALSQWIDLSLLNNNFAPGTFIGAGPFPAQPPGSFRSSFEWEGITPRRVHFYRMNAHYGGNSWREHVQGGSFLSLDCRGLPSPAPPFQGD